MWLLSQLRKQARACIATVDRVLPGNMFPGPSHSGWATRPSCRPHHMPILPVCKATNNTSGSNRPARSKPGQPASAGTTAAGKRKPTRKPSQSSPRRQSASHGTSNKGPGRPNAPGSRSYEDAVQYRSHLDDDDMLFDEEDEGVVELPGDEAIVDPEEIERLLFGGKDFSQESPSAQPTAESTSSAASAASADQRRATKRATSRQQELDACRAMLSNPPAPSPSPIPDELIQAVMSAAGAGLTTLDAEALLRSVNRLLEVVSQLPPQKLGTPTTSPPNTTEPAVIRALAGVQSCLKHDEVDLELVLSAALKLPNLLLLSHQDIRERLLALQPILSMEPSQLVPACCSHPELLVANLEDVRKKVLILRNTTGLTGLGAIEMMTPAMFNVN